jgi:hypothetical protein
MCTVTFIPSRDTIFLTSNRDEKNWRSLAFPPSVFTYQSGKIIYPKDGDAGGTWIAAHQNGNAIIFLNGGLKAHLSEPPYRKSRGLILIEIIDSSAPFNNFLATNLNNIEPFTAIIWDNARLFECRWDGVSRHSRQCNADLPHIWSSVTLYDEAVVRKRKKWFEEWIKKTPEPCQRDILNFHQFTGDGDSNNDLRMNRQGKVFTVSVTSLAISRYSLMMHYADLIGNQSFQQKLAFKKSMAGK